MPEVGVSEEGVCFKIIFQFNDLKLKNEIFMRIDMKHSYFSNYIIICCNQFFPLLKLTHHFVHVLTSPGAVISRDKPLISHYCNTMHMYRWNRIYFMANNATHCFIQCFPALRCHFALKF